MSFLFKNYSIVKVIYLLISCYKTRFFMWNANNIDRNGVNKQNTHENENFSIKISDTTPFFKTTPPILATPPIFMGKIWTPPPPFFLENFENSTPLYKGTGGWGVRVPTMLYLFQVKKEHSLIEKFLLHFLYKKQIILAA